ncbi:MAG TPA: hypothetical protein VMA83_00710 [Solirubrobacteraceae bacterium]|nr:hypothetical protein [Solirubrobacteraceae bacterium]
MIGVAEPWPDVQLLRTALETGFVDAAALELAQRAAARDLRQRLLSTEEIQRDADGNR